MVEPAASPGAVWEREVRRHRLTVRMSQPPVHSVLRTPNGNDYGKDLLRQHYEQSHS